MCDNRTVSVKAGVKGRSERSELVPCSYYSSQSTHCVTEGDF